MKTPVKSTVSRRILLAGFAVAIAAQVTTALAAQTLVEIIAFAHPPVEDALRPLRTWLQKQGTKVKVVETNMDGPEAQSKLKAIGLTGHLPIVILIDGQYQYARSDGTVVQLVSFPAAKGAWSTADVEAAIKARH